MNQVFDFIRKNRISQGLSQSQLARLSGLSLPGIQKLETPAANPSFSSLVGVLKALGFEAEFKVRTPNWDALASCGAPLAVHHGVRPTPELLLSALREACLFLGERAPADFPRERDCVAALVLALKSHFPKFYRRHFTRAFWVRPFELEPLNGRIIKLARLSVPVLAGYL